MKKYIILILSVLSIISCSRDKKRLLPDSSGKTHNILLIMDDKDWKESLGDSIRKYFAVEFNDLPQSEPLFSLQQAAPELYNGIFKTVRDAIIVKKGDKPGVRYDVDK